MVLPSMSLCQALLPVGVFCSSKSNGEPASRNAEMEDLSGQVPSVHVGSNRKRICHKVCISHCGRDETVASGFSRELKAQPNFIGNSPFETAPPQRFSVEGQIEIGGEDGRVGKFETSAKRRDVANDAPPNQRTIAAGAEMRVRANRRLSTI